MTDEDIRSLIEEATQDSLRSSFTDAGRKYLEAASKSIEKGDSKGAENLYFQAADAFKKAAEKYRSSKSYKLAALNMCEAGDVLSELGISEKALMSYEQAAEDLLGASGEHLLWGEDAETHKAAALAIVACMIYLMIGKEQEAFTKARTFSAENASKIRFPATISITQIPQMIETAIVSVDIHAFSTSEPTAITELKSDLTNEKASDFVKYIDKGLDMVREILRGKLKVPKVSTQLEIPVDMTFSEQFPLRVIINNTGEGDALSLNAEWFLDEGLDLISGDRKTPLFNLPAGQSTTIEIIAKSSEALEGVREYNVMVRGSYSDMLNTEYTLQAGPGTLVLKDFKESEKLSQEIESLKSKYQELSSLLSQSKLETEPLDKILSKIGTLFALVQSDVSESKLETAKGRIHIIESIIDTMDILLKDEALIDSVTKQREKGKHEFAASELGKMKESIHERFTGELKEIDEATEPALSEWDTRAERKQKLINQISDVKERVSDITKELENVYSKMPTAAETEDPEEAKARTKLRTGVDSIRSKLSDLEGVIIEIASAPMLEEEDRPKVPENVKMAKESLEKIMKEILQLIESKKSELT
jgi:tetratricopeptide (TPR) repeat protein